MDYEKSAGGVLMPTNRIQVGGVFDCELWRAGQMIDRWSEPNLVVNEGLDALLNIMFAGTTQITTWYLGIFEGNYTPVATVTAATITSASTECTTYDEATRVVYNEAVASGQSITNAANKATFTINTPKTIYGAFLVSASAKSATSGTLFAAARFGASKAVVDNDELLITYTFAAASS